MLRWHLWLSTHLFSLDKCDATQFLHHIGRLATAPANLQPSSRLQPMHPWSPPQLGHPWALSSSGMWANMIKASVTTAHLSYRFPILKLPPPPCAVLLVFSPLDFEALTFDPKNQTLKSHQLFGRIHIGYSKRGGPILNLMAECWQDCWWKKSSPK